MSQGENPLSQTGTVRCNSQVRRRQLAVSRIPQLPERSFDGFGGVLHHISLVEPMRIASWDSRNSQKREALKLGLEFLAEEAGKDSTGCA